MKRALCLCALGSFVLQIGCGGSTNIGSTGPNGGGGASGVDSGSGGAAGAGAPGSGGSGTGGAGGAGGCVGAPAAGGSSSVNIFIDHLISRAGCFPRALSDGASGCTIVEASFGSTGADCSAPGRRAPCSQALVENAIDRLRLDNSCGSASSPVPDCTSLRFCEIERAGETCLNVTPDPAEVGWCYIDPNQGLGDPSLVATCPAGQKQILRFVGSDTPSNGAMVLIACGAPPGP